MRVPETRTSTPDPRAVIGLSLIGPGSISGSSGAWCDPEAGERLSRCGGGTLPPPPPPSRGCDEVRGEFVDRARPAQRHCQVDLRAKHVEDAYDPIRPPHPHPPQGRPTA